ncbi:hypothetical protein [Rhizobium sp. 007]|uniref:hypothetical protein n=1 Tax=Rhizobium sp. 007 TaxID=2785056 RepID=UPI001FEFAB2C|nr:hypothetical protein [Rhizobium sp. 007]
MPALFEDRPVQARLLADVGCGRVHGSPGAARHVARGEVFQHDRCEATGDIKTGLVPPILPDAGSTGLQGCNAAAGLRVATRPALAPRQNALGPALPGLDLRKAGRHPPMLPGRKRQRVRHAPVDPHGGQIVLRDGMVDFAGEDDVPAVRRQAHRHIHGLATQAPRVAELHPADLGKARGGPLAVQALDLDLPPLKAEGAVHALLAGRGISCAPGEEVGIRLIQIAQGLLLGRHMHGGNPVERGPQGGQFPRLGDVVQAVTGLQSLRCSSARL